MAKQFSPPEMTSSLFRRLLLAALALVTATLLALYFTLANAAPDSGAVRIKVLVIASTAAIVALAVAVAVSHSLAGRVRRLKILTDSMLRVESSKPAFYSENDDLSSLEQSLTSVAGELKTMVENLRFESARREAILSGMTEGVLAVDRETRVTFCNRAFLRAIGFRGERYEGLGLLEMVRDPVVNELIRGVLIKGEPATLRFKFSADTPRTFELQATPLATPSGRGAVAIFHDITDLERLEQIRKDFVANVSHELRTPLAGIIGYADTLLDGALDDSANRRKFIEIIRANAVRLGSIAADLLVLSDLESGVDLHEQEITAVKGVVEAVLLTVESEARARDVSLVRGSIEDVYISGSRLRLEQVLLNLLANAIKFNKAGGEVQVGVTSRPGGRVAITVADTGVGIPSQDLPRIFERFYRVDKARSRQVGGTGLGLSIVKHVVERMEGTVGVESQLGKGSTFTVLIPMARVPQSL